MKRVIATGRTVEDAITSALVRLGATRAEAEVKVLTEPAKGLFGLFGSREAEVEVTVPSTPEEEAVEFLTEVLSRMGVNGSARVRHGLQAGFLEDVHEGADSHRRQDEVVELELICGEEELPVVIGRHGSTLDSLQFLVNVVANQRVERRLRFVVDAGDYRRRRQENLLQIADRAADKALRTRQPVSLRPMSASERKLVHTHLQRRGDVRTVSEGEEPNRRVVVVPLHWGTPRARMSASDARISASAMQADPRE
ncbi:MAG: protein jag [Alicyclobacillus herbarius]|uniref:RNA-binding cell elongation regulator Jag/EloR n=1 Tax=Alicyclobacillus herbarius TaxID=122960 RepID=UPI002356525A|nr:RNA-binding cell elongation regulator Jag/EloR [Alicyclobacillus herbarius]MCL6631778.1 protein jag [Alicyclobacillus herbarius]